MSRDKQIEEMANIYEEARYKANETLGSMNGGACMWYAEAFYNAGYRKVSEVARGIIKDLVKFADDKERQRLINGHSVWYIEADDVTDFIAELKKKYTEDK